MRKLATRLSLVATSLALIGAGCKYPPPGAPAANQESASPKALTQPLNDFTVTAEALNPGIVKITWTAPATSGPNTAWRVLHSARPNPTLEGKAYWFQRSSSDARDASFGKLPPGKRYFRVCEFKNEKCARYSNEVIVEVK